MKEFISTNNQEFLFGDCANCEATCCNGKSGTIFSQILNSEFDKIYENFPILFIFGDLNFTKAVVLLTNGEGFCPYLIDFKCTIYEKRPTVCKTYPLSPHVDNQIYIDTNCQEVGNNSFSIIKNNKINKSFDDEVFHDYLNKHIETHFEFENMAKSDFKKLFSIKNIDFFEYIGKENSKYIKMHKKSLINLKNYF